MPSLLVAFSAWMALVGLLSNALEWSQSESGSALRLDAALACSALPDCPLGVAASNAQALGPLSNQWLLLPRTAQSAPRGAFSRFGAPDAFKPAGVELPNMSFAWRGRSQSKPRGVGRRARALNELDEALGLLSPQAAHADRERLSIDSCLRRPQAASRSSSRL